MRRGTGLEAKHHDNNEYICAQKQFMNGVALAMDKVANAPSDQPIEFYVALFQEEVSTSGMASSLFRKCEEVPAWA